MNPNIIEASAPNDFSYDIQGDRLKIKVEGLQRAYKMGSLESRQLLFDSETLGARSYSKWLHLPYNPGKVLIERDGGEDIIITCRSPIDSTPKQNGRFLGFKYSHLTWALVFHLLLGGLFYLKEMSGFDFSYFQDSSQSAQSSSQAEDSADETSQSDAAAVGALPTEQRSSFVGQSLWYHRYRGDNKFSRKRLSNLISGASVARSDSPQAGSGTGKGNGGSFVNSFKIGVGSTRSLKLAKTDKPKKEFTRQEKLKAERQLKAAFDRLQPRFRRVYDALVKKDPNFSVHIVLTAVVGTNGRMKSVDTSSTGARPDQRNLVNELNQSIKAEVKKLNVSKSLASFTVRRELIFWR